MLTLTEDDIERIKAIARNEMYKALWEARENDSERHRETTNNSDAIDNIIVSLLSD